MKSIYRILLLFLVLNLVLTEVLSRKRIKTKKNKKESEQETAETVTKPNDTKEPNPNYVTLKTQQQFQMNEVPEELKDDKLQLSEIAKRESTLSTFAVTKVLSIFGNSAEQLDNIKKCNEKLTPELRITMMHIFHDRVKLNATDKTYLKIKRQIPIICNNPLETMWKNLSNQSFKWKTLANQLFYRQRRLRKLRKALKKRIARKESEQ